MNEKKPETDLQQWFSTYGILTAEGILKQFRIHLSQKEIFIAVKNSRSVYYQLLREPLKNVFNGLILQQAYDYQVYAQKMFVDYLISGAADIPEDFPGHSIRESLEQERNTLSEMNEAFQTLQTAHQQNIAGSQARLMKFASELQQLLQRVIKKIHSLLENQIAMSMEQQQIALRQALIKYGGTESEMSSRQSDFWTELEKNFNIQMNDRLFSQLQPIIQTFSEHCKAIDEELIVFMEKTDELRVSLRNARRQFYELILRVKDLIHSLPDYKNDEEREASNLESLDFDSKIGESEA